MAVLCVNLLGTVALELDGQPLKFTRRKALALLLFLACAGRTQSRTTLISLIGGDKAEPKAAMALSNALRDLRPLLGPHLSADIQQVTLADSLTISSDVQAFVDSVTAARAANEPAELRAALTGYGGEFAAGLIVRGAPAFDEWLHHERQRLYGLYISALEHGISAATSSGDLASAIDLTRRLLAAEPWREEAHRSLMRLLCRDGQRSAALRQFEYCRAALQRELGAEPDNATIAVYAQLQAGPQTPPHNLPARTTTFVDRPHERVLLSTQLQRTDCRLVTIVGIGGSGKTRLALEVATQFTRPALPDETTFADGVFFATLAEPESPTGAAADEEQVAQVLVRSLELSTRPGVEPQRVLLDWLASRSLLLVIDNAEVALPAIGMLVTILTVAPAVRLLVTSRVRLQLEAEWVLDLGGLSLPSDPGDLLASGAGQLFLERARATRLDRPPDSAEYPHIVQICRLVNGLPLALVLAAGRLRTLSCAAIAAHLAHSTSLLVSNAADLPARQRNLNAVLRWSWQQLGPAEVRALSRLAVFAGSCDLAAALAVCACDLAVLDVLVDYGLLTRDAAGHFSLHPLVRHMAAAELASRPAEQATAAARHATHFAALATAVAARVGHDVTALHELTGRWNDLRIAWDWAVEHGSVEHLRQLRSGFVQACDALGLYRSGIVHYTAAAAILHGNRAPTALAPHVAVEVAELLLAAAWLHARLAETGSAVALTREARVYAEAGCSEVLVARSEQLQGILLYLQTRYRAAQPLLEHAYELARQRNDHDTEIEILSFLARMAYWCGDPGLLRRVSAIVEQRFVDRSGSLEMAYIRLAAAHLAAEHGDPAPARLLIEQYEPVQVEPGHHQLTFWYELLHMHLALLEGRLAVAEQILLRMQQLATTLNNGFIMVNMTFLLGRIYIVQGDVLRGDQLAAQSLQNAQAVDAPRHCAAALHYRAYAAQLKGEYRRACQLAGEALTITRAEGYRRLERGVLLTLGHALAGCGQFAAADDCYAQAHAIDESSGHAVLAAEAAAAQAEICRLQGDPAAARELLAPYITLLLHSDLFGAEEPVHTLTTAAQALSAAGDPRGAQLHARARRELARRADLVTPERRQSFLTNIPAHRALMND